MDYLDEIVGQETAKRFVRTAIKKDNLYNLLFIGPKGVGKRLFGFALAKALNCPPHSTNFRLIAPIPSRIKNKKERIYEYTKLYMPEYPLIHVEDRTSILIEQIRELIESLVHMPNAQSKRVVLILEADRMTPAAANCFLKTLEEPPLDTVFVLTTSRPNFLLPTIRSRCRIVPFNYLTNDQIKDIVLEGTDVFHIGSPGEIMQLQNNNLLDQVSDIFKNSPLDAKQASILAKTYERKKIVDLLYPLLLLYRLVLYTKLHLTDNSRFQDIISKKAKSISLTETINTIMLLNYSINILEQNPNHLLLLFSILTKLP
jgi:DNA polymerase III delta prime subunit